MRQTTDRQRKLNTKVYTNMNKQLTNFFIIFIMMPELKLNSDKIKIKINLKKVKPNYCRKEIKKN